MKYECHETRSTTFKVSTFHNIIFLFALRLTFLRACITRIYNNLKEYKSIQSSLAAHRQNTLSNTLVLIIVRSVIFHKVTTMASQVPTITLNNGLKIPQLGLGTWNVSIEN